MTNGSLAEAYLQKATARIDVLELLSTKQAWSDVVREAQEIVELALKGMLRYVGVEPPKWHDVGGILVEHGDRFPGETRESLLRMADVSKRLRKERELSFYGDIDFIPTEEYSEELARDFASEASYIVHRATVLMERKSATKS